MKLVEQYLIKKTNPMFKECKDLCFKSKNLYNRALYEIRQEYINNKKYLNYFNIEKLCKKEKWSEYEVLPRKVSQQTLKLLDKNWKSFFALLKSEKVNNKKVKLPKYLNKVKGKFIVVYTNQAILKRLLKRGIIKLSGTDIRVRTHKKNIKQVRIVPQYGRFVIELVYEIPDVKAKKDNKRYCSIDLGLNNLATIGSIIIKPFIINGKPLKSINQYFNKMTAKEKSLLPKGVYTNENLERLYLKRDNKIKDYLHKASRYIINHLVSNSINTLVIGHNKNWKQEINIGKKNNQNFVNIPFNNLIHMLTYKAQLEGIQVIEIEESYTSKCSFLDNEKICKHENYLGKRIKRGLFKASNGKLINADLNGALNILRKVVGEFQYSIEVCSTPLKLTC